MARRDRYPFAKATQKLCAVLKLPPVQVLRRAGLPADSLTHEGKGITADRVFDLWNAIVAEARRPDLPLFLGRTMARGPFVPAVFAFSCSPNIEIGLTRLALFKPLVGPIALTVERADGAVTVGIGSIDPDTPMPASMAAFELVYFLELARTLTAEHIVPLSVSLSGLPGDPAGLEAHFGVAADIADRATLVLSIEDAERPIISEDAGLWADVEVDLRRQLLDRDRHAPMSTRVQNALLEMLPSGRCSAGAVCARLHVSKRSLYRHLRNEGQSFQAVLDATRSELSLYYLTKQDISIEEISYLLAFRDPNSFYRAFRGWTGMTPMEARSQRAH